MACKNGVCGLKKPAQNKYQARANKKVQKANAKAQVKQAKAENKAIAQQPIQVGRPVPEPATGNPEIQPGGLQALNGMQGQINAPLAPPKYDPNFPVTYQQPGPGFFHGTNANISYYPQFEPEQNEALSRLLQGGLGALGNLQPLDFQPQEDRAIREFQNQTIPSLAERFTSLGGGQRSSAFQGALGQAGSDLQSQLANLRSKYGLLANEQRLQQALPQLQFGLQPRRESVYTPRQASGISNLFGGITQGVGNAFGSLAKLGLG